MRSPGFVIAKRFRSEAEKESLSFRKQRTASQRLVALLLKERRDEKPRVRYREAAKRLHSTMEQAPAFQ